MHRFDIEVEDSHNYLVDGVMVHNSPEVTPGGRALKFYSSVRLDIRRIESIKDGTDVVGNRTRVKVVKNKCAAPFRQAEFDIMYGQGISREGSVLDVAVELGFVKKAGAWFTYEGEQMGQGRENVKTFLRENPQTMAEIDERVRAHLAEALIPDVVGSGRRSRHRLADQSRLTDVRRLSRRDPVISRVEVSCRLTKSKGEVRPDSRVPTLGVEIPTRTSGAPDGGRKLRLDLAGPLRRLYALWARSRTSPFSAVVNGLGDVVELAFLHEDDGRVPEAPCWVRPA